MGAAYVFVFTLFVLNRYNFAAILFSTKVHHIQKQHNNFFFPPPPCLFFNHLRGSWLNFEQNKRKSCFKDWPKFSKLLASSA